MDLISIVLWMVVIYIFWILINTISSLRDEIKEMRSKCISAVLNNDGSSMDSSNTKDPKREIIDKFYNITQYIKNML